MNDSYVIPLIVLPLFLATFILARLLTVFLHELGHAIPAMIFTDKVVTIFLGSHGDDGRSKRIQFGNKLVVYFRLNPFKWQYGMVKHFYNGSSFLKALTISILGPLFSLLIALMALFLVFNYDLNGFLKLFTLLFFFSALFDLRNMYPSTEPIVLVDGSITYNDGHKIKELIKFKKDRKIVFEAYEFFNDDHFEKTIELIEQLNPEYVSKDILSTAVNACIQVKNYTRAKLFYEKFIYTPVFENLNSDYFFNIGLVESMLNEHDLAMNYYNRSLDLDNDNVNSLCNRGYTYNLQERYVEALADFDKAIEIDNELAYAYANRAFTKIKTKLFEDALADINRALSIDNKNSYAYRNLGVYYLDTSNLIKAKEQFQIAYDLNSDTHMINNYVKMTEDQLNFKAV